MIFSIFKKSPFVTYKGVDNIPTFDIPVLVLQRNYISLSGNNIAFEFGKKTFFTKTTFKKFDIPILFLTPHT